MRELRGIVVDMPKGAKKVRLVTRGERGDDYETLAYPSSSPLNFGKIRVFLGTHYGCPPGDIKIPRHIKIPK